MEEELFYTIFWGVILLTNFAIFNFFLWSPAKKAQKEGGKTIFTNKTTSDAFLIKFAKLNDFEQFDFFFEKKNIYFL